MSELKPCPFCGDGVEMVNTKTYPNGERSPAYIKCKTCNYHIADYEDEILIHQWNTRRDASLLTEGEQREILSYIRGNYDRDKIPCWLLDLIDGVARRDEIITRLKEAGENLIQLANFNNMKAVEYTDAWCALMDEFGNLPR